MRRMIGIDLGTSSSMIKTKEYPDGVSPEAVSLDCKAVVFTQQKMASTPTLIRERGEKRWYGYDAEQNPIKDSTLHQNFKIDLREKDSQAQARAVELTEEFFRFLHDCYVEQRQFLFDLNKDSSDEETMVSYPAQWDEGQREIVLDAARKAGFPNVKGMDEAAASVYCILYAKKRELVDKGLLRAGKPLNAVIVDMGAGTADLAFVRITLDAKLKTEILDTWPPADSGHIFGGSRLDELLAERMEKWLEDSGLAPNQAKSIIKGQRSAIKQWKEITVSSLLASGQAVDDCAAVSGMCACMGMDLNPFPILDRKSFAQDFLEYIKTFVALVNSAPQDLREATQMVILTGGNSQWYWIDDILTGADGRFGRAGLPLIESHPELILRMELPTETVSRGLVFSQQMQNFFNLEKNGIKPPKKDATPADDLIARATALLDACMGPDGKLKVSGNEDAVSKALRWFQKAAQMGSDTAAYLYGKLLFIQGDESVYTENGERLIRAKEPHILREFVHHVLLRGSADSEDDVDAIRQYLNEGCLIRAGESFPRCFDNPGTYVLYLGTKALAQGRIQDAGRHFRLMEEYGKQIGVNLQVPDFLSAALASGDPVSVRSILQEVWSFLKGKRGILCEGDADFMRRAQVAAQTYSQKTLPLAVCEKTILGFVTSGFALFEQGIGYKNMGSSPQFVAYASLDTAEIEVKDSFLALGVGRYLEININDVLKEDVDEMTSALVFSKLITWPY